MAKKSSRTKLPSLHREMMLKLKAGTRDNSTRANAIRACEMFDDWRKEKGYTNKAVFEHPAEVAQAWLDERAASGKLASGTIKTNAAGLAKGLGIKMADLHYDKTPRPSRTKSRGTSERSQNAFYAPRNKPVIEFQSMVGIRRKELEDLRGSDFGYDESGKPCVIVRKGKGGKCQYQVIAPENVSKVKSYFEGKAPTEKVFGKVDRHLDLHAIRAEHAREEYKRYCQICETEEGRQQLREELWARYYNPDHGCKDFLIAKSEGDKETMHRAEANFESQMKDGKYCLREANRVEAKERGLPTSYDRLAMCAVSVFALSHWRNDVTVKHYMM